MNDLPEKSTTMGNLDVDLSNVETAMGEYSNFAMVAHSSEEFVMDFARVMPGLDHAVLISRLILTPCHAKRFFFSLHENISRYEEQYGEINVQNFPEPNDGLDGAFLGGTRTEA